MTCSLKKQIYGRILEGIIRKDYPVDYILKEKELSEQFGVSRAPVREALIELSTEDIVKSIPRAGYRIVQFTEKDIREITELRLALELPVLDKIVPPAAAGLESLEALSQESNYERRCGTITLDKWWDNNIRFHLALNSLGGNSLITATLETVIHRQWRIIAQLFWHGVPGDYINFATDHHETLVRAITTGDKRRAKKTLSKDILSIGEFSARRP